MCRSCLGQSSSSNAAGWHGAAGEPFFHGWNVFRGLNKFAAELRSTFPVVLIGKQIGERILACREVIR
jgi:hypothetical protein